MAHCLQLRFMQVAARTAIQELARGLSTAAIVLAGTQTPQCTCICPSCPDCNCAGSERVCPAPPPCAASGGVPILVGFVLGVVVALFCVAVTEPRRHIEVVVPASRPCIEEVVEEVDVAHIARQQSLQLRHGARGVPRS